MANTNSTTSSKPEPDGTARTPKPSTPKAQESTWLDPGTWSLSFKLLPVAIALLGVFVAVYYNHFMYEAALDMTSYESCTGTFNYTFRVNAVLEQSQHWSKESWEVALAHEATQQIYNPERSVFAPDYLPDGKPPSLKYRMDEASLFARKSITSGGRTSVVEDTNATVSGPASLGIAEILLGQRWQSFMIIATMQKDFLLKTAPRSSMGAISHTIDEVELSAEAILRFPPFLAYYGAVHGDRDLMREAVTQCRLYRDALVLDRNSGPRQGLWRHKEGLSGADEDATWSTANGAAAFGMTKVLATIANWPVSNSMMPSEKMPSEKKQLADLIGEILDAVMQVESGSSGLLRNYLGEDYAGQTWEGEISGTSLLAATVYRMAVLRPNRFARPKYLRWADSKRQAVFQHIDENGFARPASDPYNPTSKEEVSVSPEGQSYLLLLGAAWRDCVCAGICLDDYLIETGSKLTRSEPSEGWLAGLSFESVTGVAFERISGYLRQLEARFFP